MRHFCWKRRWHLRFGPKPVQRTWPALSSTVFGLLRVWLNAERGRLSAFGIWTCVSPKYKCCSGEKEPIQWLRNNFKHMIVEIWNIISFGELEEKEKPNKNQRTETNAINSMWMLNLFFSVCCGMDRSIRLSLRTIIMSLNPNWSDIYTRIREIFCLVHIF